MRTHGGHSLLQDDPHRHGPPLCQGKSMDGLRQMRQHQLEGVPGVRDAMQKQQGNACGVSLFDILELDPIGKLNRFDHRCRPLSHHLLSPPLSACAARNASKREGCSSISAFDQTCLKRSSTFMASV
jgi:hypothetical protein